MRGVRVNEFDANVFSSPTAGQCRCRAAWRRGSRPGARCQVDRRGPVPRLRRSDGVGRSTRARSGCRISDGSGSMVVTRSSANEAGRLKLPPRETRRPLPETASASYLPVHQSQTFPATSCRPNGFAGKMATGACTACLSSLSARLWSTNSLSPSASPYDRGDAVVRFPASVPNCHPPRRSRKLY
jgi:hypothetical protein